MKTRRVGSALLSGAVFVVVACAEPAGPTGDHGTSLMLAAERTAPRDLGTLGGLNSSATDINDAGVVVGSSDVAGEIHAFRWSPSTGMVDLGTVGGTFSAALQINRSGFVLGTSRTAQGDLHIVLWDPQNRLLDLGQPPGPGGWGVAAMNDHNVIVGDAGMDESSLPHQFRWTREAGYAELYPGTPRMETYVSAIGNDGSLAGTGGGVGTAMYGWYLSLRSREFVELGAPGGDLGWADGINDRHQVVGFDAGGPSNPFPRPYSAAPFVWTPGRGFTDLGTLGGTVGYARDINNRGEIVGVSTLIPWDEEAPATGFFYTTELGMVPLPGRDGGLSGASAINLKGMIAGAVQTPAGPWHAALWNRPTGSPPPAPALRQGPMMGAGRIGECLTDREVQRSRARTLPCLADGPARAALGH